MNETVSTVSYDGQVTSTISLFTTIAGIAITALGFIIAAYMFRRDKVKSTPDERTKRIMRLLTDNFLQMVSPIIICIVMMALMMNGGLNPEGQFTVNSGLGLAIGLFALPVLLSIAACYSFIKYWDTRKQITFKYELTYGIILFAFSVISFIAALEPQLNVFVPAALCLCQILQILIQTWHLMQNEKNSAAI